MTVYTGVNGVLEIGGVATAFAEFSVRINRGQASHARAGKYSDIKRPGKIEITGTIRRIQSDAAMLGKLISPEAITGEAEILHAGLTLDGSETMHTMTEDDAKNSRIKLTALTEPITTGGVATIIGTDVNDNPQTENITIPLLADGDSISGTKVFKTVSHVALFDVDSTEGGTLKVESIEGASSYTIDDGAVFDLVGKVEKNGKSIIITCNNCFLTEGEMNISDADTILSEPLGFTLQDPDEDFSISET